MSADAFWAQIKKLEALRHADSPPLEEFDAETEQLIRSTFGETHANFAAYELATQGEAEALTNIPQGAQEDATQDVPLKAIEQRRQVLEACLSELRPPLEEEAVAFTGGEHGEDQEDSTERR